jgi:hypothetical protein
MNIFMMRNNSGRVLKSPHEIRRFLCMSKNVITNQIEMYTLHVYNAVGRARVKHELN